MFLDLVDTLRYDVLGQEPPALPKFDPNLSFEVHKERKGYWVTSKTHPGLIASGDTLEELRSAIFDTILTYYNVPRYHAKRFNDNLTLHLSDGTSVLPPEPVFQAKLKWAN